VLHDISFLEYRFFHEKGRILCKYTGNNEFQINEPSDQ
jgi:hypothetical protein